MLTKEAIIGYAKESGFLKCGFVATDDFTEYETILNNIVNIFPETKQLYTPMYKRAYVTQNTPWAKSIIVCIRSYSKYKIPKKIKGYIGRNYLFDSRIPDNPDYQITKKFVSYLKNAGIRVKKGGVPDRLVAAKSGIVSIGKNNFAYSEVSGSWLNISTYVVDISLEPDNLVLKSPCPPGCDICIKACPTKALTSPYTMRMDRCIAFLTYGQHQGIPEELSHKMGRWIYGCDICQEVCPLNKGKWQETTSLEHLENISEILTPEYLSVMEPEVYKNVIYPLFNYIPLKDINRWHTNAKRALKYKNYLTTQHKGG